MLLLFFFVACFLFLTYAKSSLLFVLTGGLKLEFLFFRLL